MCCPSYGCQRDRYKSPNGPRVCDPGISLTLLKEVSVLSTMAHPLGIEDVDSWVKVNSGWIHEPERLHVCEFYVLSCLKELVYKFLPQIFLEPSSSIFNI